MKKIITNLPLTAWKRTDIQHRENQLQREGQLNLEVTSIPCLPRSFLMLMMMMNFDEFYHLNKIIETTPTIIVSEARHCWKFGI